MTTIKSFTSLEQSKKLAEILPLESADNYYAWHDERYYVVNKDCPYPFSLKEKIPCWSLAALLGVFPYYEINNNGVNIQLSIKGEALITEKGECLLDLVVNMIIHLHELNLL